MVFYEELVQYPTYKNNPRLITKKWLDAKMASVIQVFNLF